MTNSWLRRVFILVVATALAGRAFAQQPAPAAGQPLVFVVPMNGPVYYKLAATELTKILRSALVQKPVAIVLVISSPGGDWETTFEMGQQIVDLGLPNTVAYVAGSYGGAFGSTILPLLACRQVYVAPDNTIDPRSIILDSASATAGTIWAPRRTSAIQSWAAQNHLPWPPVRQWLAEAGLLGSAVVPANPTSPVPSPLPGLKPLQAKPAADLQAVFQSLGIFSPRVITWPDPITRANNTLQRAFQQADDLVKAGNAAIAAAREADPRAHRYELQDVTREQTIGTIVKRPRSDLATEYRTTDQIVSHDLFADGGAAWRTHTDQCIDHVREAMTQNRRLAALIARYPEIAIDPKEIGDSYATLNTWLSQLRTERPLRSPPGNP